MEWQTVQNMAPKFFFNAQLNWAWFFFLLINVKMPTIVWAWKKSFITSGHEIWQKRENTSHPHFLHHIGSLPYNHPKKYGALALKATPASPPVPTTKYGGKIWRCIHSSHGAVSWVNVASDQPVHLLNLFRRLMGNGYCFSSYGANILCLAVKI